MAEVIICSRCGRPYSSKGKPEGLSASKAAIGGAIAGPTGAIVGAAMGDRPNVTECPYCGASAYASRLSNANSSVTSNRPTPPAERDKIVHPDGYVTVNFIKELELEIDKVLAYLREAVNADSKNSEWKEWGSGTHITVGFRHQQSAWTSWCGYYDLVGQGSSTTIHCWTDTSF